ncbi:MAG: limonene-1,2-epoxide hydrolase family protein [Actinomycetota bacterium]|nr:limonene-1,2-epoxide hydrolase family protein [Actinomycetota bacterium]
MSNPNEIFETFLDSLESCDIDRILQSFTEQSSWQNVPHVPAVGLSEIRAAFESIVQRSSRIQWDVVSSAFEGSRGWIERVDRFWIDGIEYAVRCNGVFDFDVESSSILSVRDYVDLGEWRSRLADAKL